MCPGWTRSCGRVRGSIATWIVWARSWAEMPVVTPSRASIETVKAVSNADSFLAAIRSSPSSSQRSPVSARQIRPAGVHRHEVDRVGRGELGREGEVALVLAVLGVADDDHLAVADVLEGLLDRAEGGVRSRRHVRDTSFSTYLASTSTSRLTDRPGAAAPRLVRSSVSGISETEKPSPSTSATVSDTPSTAIEPFSTT